MRSRPKRKTVFRFGAIRQFGRAVLIEGVGLALLAAVVGLPLLNSSTPRFSCLEAEPSAIDQSVGELLAFVGILDQRP